MTKFDNNLLTVLCETLERALGVDNPNPRFSWHPQKAQGAKPQKSYRINVAYGEKTVWDSGEIESKQSIAVEYMGEVLESCTEYTVTVNSTLTDGSVYSGKCVFETGILHRKDWVGEFLSHPAYEKRSSPVFVMKPEFSGNVKKCRAYFCGLGYGELYINGIKTCDSLLDPGWTDFDYRLLYRTLDVTDLIRSGKNRIRVLLGDGWMAHNHKYFETSRKPPLPWYHEPCFLLNILVEYEDGRIEKYAPDEGDCLANFSEIISQNIFDGEIYDARRAKALASEEAGELKAENGWVRPIAVAMTGKLTSQLMPPIGITEVIKPIKVTSNDPITYTVDMGVNFSGVMRINVIGEAGSEISLRHAEAIRDDGSINQENLRYAEACDKYILCGDGSVESYMPRFTYHGFRFVEIKINGKAKVLEIEGVRVNSAVKRIGRFECDDEMINKLYKLLINTEMNNLHSLPTDCPQRDERLAWLNDSMMRLEQNVMNFDSQLLFEKFMNDIVDTQSKKGTGAIPDTCPYYYGMFPARWNGSVMVALPYAIYLYYGDSQAVRKYWENMLWYMDFQRSKLTDEGLINEYYVGEWCPPMKDSILEDKQSAFARDIKNQLATSCFYFLECELCRRMAIIVGDKEREEQFAEYRNAVREAINAKYFDAEKNAYIPECQGNSILPLRFGIVPDEKKEEVEDKLLYYVTEKDNYHISTGSHTTRFLFDALSAAGESDTALRMLRVKEYPSFGYMMENGATTLWERWEKTFGFMTSYDHPMSGGFGVWFFKTLGGICVDSTCEGRLIISPDVPEDLGRINCSRVFRNGRVISNWYKEGKSVHYDIEIPWNTDAEIIIKLKTAGDTVTVNGIDAKESPALIKFKGTELRLGCNGGYLHIVDTVAK